MGSQAGRCGRRRSRARPTRTRPAAHPQHRRAGRSYGPTTLDITTDGGHQWSSVAYPGENAGAKLEQLAINGGQVVVVTVSADGQTLQASRSPLGQPHWSSIPGGTLAASPVGDGPDLAVAVGYGVVLSGSQLVGGPLAGAWIGHAVPCPPALTVVTRVTAYDTNGLYVACSSQGEGGQYEKATFGSIDGGVTFFPTGYGPRAAPPTAGQLKFVSAVNYEAYMATTGADSEVWALRGAMWVQTFSAGDGQPVRDFGFTNEAQGLLVLGDPSQQAAPGNGLYLTRDGGATWSLTDFTMSSLPPTCRPDRLQLTEGTGDAGLSNTATAFVFRTAGAPCSLHGYPGVTFKGADGTTLAVASRSPSSYLVQVRPEIPVVVSTQAPASFFISGTDNPPSGTDSSQLLLKWPSTRPVPPTRSPHPRTCCCAPG